MIQQAVKTRNKALKIIEDYLGNNLPEPDKDGQHLEAIVDNTTGRCECGETNAVVGHWEGGSYSVTVVICDACGDDDAFEDDVTHIQNYEVFP